MALFGFGKKQANAAPAVNLSGIVRIEVLGSGCKNCHNLLEAATQAVDKLGLPVKVEYVTDMAEVAKYGAMRMPALVVNDKVVSMGKVLKADEVESLIKGLLAK